MFGGSHGIIAISSLVGLALSLQTSEVAKPELLICVQEMN